MISCTGDIIVIKHPPFSQLLPRLEANNPFSRHLDMAVRTILTHVSTSVFGMEELFFASRVMSWDLVIVFFIGCCFAELF